MIATVRVANPADPTRYMTINARDYRVAVHGELWPKQAEGFTGILPTPEPTQMDPAVRDFAASLMFDILDMEQRAHGSGPAFSSLSPGQQLTFLRDKRTEFEDAKRSYLRSRQVSEKQAAEDAAEAAARDAAHAAQQSQQAAQQAPATQPVEPPAPPAAPQAPAAAAPAAQPAGNAPAGAPWAKAPAPPASPLTVEKGPGSKWYVMKDKAPVTPGFATKAEAEKAMAEVGKE